ncbi:MAG: cysteine synthase A [Muribaculaceae bacterium]|nr:cysteine synthase A [Muribaculaceae bacterium]
MAKIAKSLIEYIGNTPLLELVNFGKKLNISTPIIAKLELFNPAGSVKDRTALSMINDAEKKGILKQGGTIIEPTSGNTGVGIALIAACRGYKSIFTMPDTMSMERRTLLKALGAKVVLTTGTKGMMGAIEKANELHQNLENSFIPQQFENPANLEAHTSTANEIWKDTDGKVDFFIAGVGTGGTVCGVAKRLKELNPNIKAIAIEPAESPIISGGKAGQHNIQGIGANFIPKIYDASLIDEVITVKTEDAIRYSRILATSEGLMVGISSGAAVKGAMDIASRPENKDKCIVTLFPDTGERYLTTALYAFEEYPL